MAIKTAIIGLGIMGRRMLEHMMLHDQFAPDFIWDPDAAACQQA
ncbi:MAG: 3-hydroxyisobutyrate dehydrogenase-like beta-hydroxyacid dehydrogenase, partial [Paracoccaceae bacterium]